MSVTLDILRMWRAPRAVIRARLAGRVREDRTLAVLMGACALMFVAQWPAAARAAYVDPLVPLEARLAGAMMSTLFLAPLIFYALAAIGRLVAGLLGGKGTYYSARVALFWSLLAVSPAMLFQGLVAGFIGPGPLLSVIGIAVLAAFLFIWGAALRQAELEPSPASA